jgi:D-alanyl-D-alanine carboxypeptidase
MKKRIWMLALLGHALAAQAAHAGTHHHQLKPDNSLSHPKRHKAASLKVQSHIALIYDEQTRLPLYNKNSEMIVPIASITKLMTAMVMLDAKLPMDEAVNVTEDDLNKIRRAKSNCVWV